MRNKRLRSLAVNLAVTGVTVILLVVASEVGLRLFGNPVFARHNRLFVQYDTLLGWVKIPGMKGRHTTIEYDIRESFNSRGIRGPEYQYEKRPDEYRVMVLGDSFAEGYSVEFDELCSEVIGRNLDKRGDREYTVINAGTGGYSTDQEYIFFEKEGRRYSPDVTVLLFCSNDVLGNSRQVQYRGQKPTFKLVAGDLVLTNVPVPRPQPETAADGTSSSSLIDRTKQWLFAHSVLYAHIRRAVVTYQPLYRFLVEHGLADHPEDTYGEDLLPDEFRYWSRSKDSVSAGAWEITEALLVELDRVAASAGSKFLVYYIPSSAAVYDKEWQATRDAYGMPGDDWSINQVAIELGEICRRYNIDFIDPTARFREEARRLEGQGKNLYFEHDRHWTAAGQRLCGDMITDYIVEDLDARAKVHTAHADF